MTGGGINGQKLSAAPVASKTRSKPKTPARGLLKASSFLFVSVFARRPLNKVWLDFTAARHVWLPGRERGIYQQRVTLFAHTTPSVFGQMDRQCAFSACGCERAKADGVIALPCMRSVIQPRRECLARTESIAPFNVSQRLLRREGSLPMASPAPRSASVRVCSAKANSTRKLKGSAGGI